MKTARILTVVTLAVALLGAVLVTGWAVLAQEGTPQSPSGDQSPSGEVQLDAVVLDAATLEAARSMPLQQAAETLEPVRQQARQAMAAGRYELAASLSLQLADNLPKSPRTASAVLMAADSYGRAGLNTEAIKLYERAISTAKELLVVDYSKPAGQRLALSFNPDSARDTLRRALKHKAELHQSAGDIQAAWDAVQQFRAEEPEFHHLRDILPLQAQLQDVDPATLLAREYEAGKLSDEAKWAWRKGDDKATGAFADAAISQYPDSGGALLARQTKARMLWRLKRYAESRMQHEEILNRVGKIAPTCELARVATSRVAWLDTIDRIRACLAVCKQGRQPSAEQWKAAEETALTVRRTHEDPGIQADVEAMEMEIFAWKGQPAEVVERANRFWATYGDGPKAKIKTPQFERSCAWAHVYAGDALMSEGKYAEARPHFQAVIDAYADKDDSWLAPDGLARMYWNIWYGLRKSGDSGDELRSIGGLLRSRFSGSRFAAIVQRLEAADGTHIEPTTR